MKILLLILSIIITCNSYSKSWTKEFNGFSSSEKINLSDGRTLSHYKNKEEINMNNFNISSV